MTGSDDTPLLRVIVIVAAGIAMVCVSFAAPPARRYIVHVLLDLTRTNV
jgi:hypothetical protein